MKFPLRTYVAQAKANGASKLYLDEIRKRATPLATLNIPVLLSLGHIAFATGCPFPALLAIIRRRNDPYRIFAINKRSGGLRYICVPNSSLMKAQRWIHENILISKTVLNSLSSAVKAYVPGAGHMENASAHLHAEWLVKIDLRRFFESISERQVYNVFISPGYRPLVAFCLARICTRTILDSYDYRNKIKRWGRRRSNWLYATSIVQGHLPQGAPSSPMLANLVCRKMDSELEQLSQSYDLIYTRYADDLAFSGEFASRADVLPFLKEVVKIVGREGFQINDQKTNIARSGTRKIVTGLSIQEDNLKVSKPYKDKIRQELYFIRKFGLDFHLSKIGYQNQWTYLARLQGRIIYVRKIEYAKGTAMINEFNRLFPDYRSVYSILK